MKQDPWPLHQQSAEVLNESIRSKLLSRFFLHFGNIKEIRSPNDAWNSYLKTWDHLNSQSFQELMANVLMHVGLWPITIILNPSWKTEVRKSAWIKPWFPMRYFKISLYKFILTFILIFQRLQLGYDAVYTQIIFLRPGDMAYSWGLWLKKLED